MTAEVRRTPHRRPTRRPAWGGEERAVADSQQDAGCGPDPDAGHRGQDPRPEGVEDLLHLCCQRRGGVVRRTARRRDRAARSPRRPCRTRPPSARRAPRRRPTSQNPRLAHSSRRTEPIRHRSDATPTDRTAGNRARAAASYSRYHQRRVATMTGIRSSITTACGHQVARRRAPAPSATCGCRVGLSSTRHRFAGQSS
jgi:hypothetical protein